MEEFQIPEKEVGLFLLYENLGSSSQEMQSACPHCGLLHEIVNPEIMGQIPEAGGLHSSYSSSGT
jgi:hypothetical protein